MTINIISMISKEGETFQCVHSCSIYAHSLLYMHERFLLEKYAFEHIVIPGTYMAFYPRHYFRSKLNGDRNILVQ